MPIRPKKDQNKLTKRVKRDLVCISCSKPFSSSAPNAKYCWSCRNLRFRPRNKTETRICDFCKTEFETTYGWARFCCTKCRNNWHRQDMAQQIERLRRTK